MIRIGIISDTHGLLRPEAGRALAGCDAIIHAGDIGKPAVLDGLREMASLTAIRGNVDTWAEALPDTETVEFGGRRIYVIHDLKELDFDPAEAGYDVVISGHSHKPGQYRKDGVLYLNPGSAGPRRFRLPVALARLVITDSNVDSTIIELNIQK